MSDIQVGPRTPWGGRLVELLAPDRPWPRRPLWRYVLAAAIVAAATLLRWAVLPWMGPVVPYNFALVAVVVVTVLLGIGPGLLAVVLGDLAVEAFVLGSLSGPIEPATLGRLVTSMAIGVFLACLIHAARVAAWRSRRSEARLAAFAAASFEGIVESEGGLILDCNEQFARLAGGTVAGLKGTPIIDLVAAEDRDRVGANLRENREVVIEHAMVRKDGTRIFVEAHGRPLSPGSARRFSAVRDITARIRAEQEVQTDKERLACLVDSMSDEVWFADTNRTFTLANPSAIREFGLSSPDGTEVERLAASLEVYRADGTPRPVEEAPPLRALAGEVVRAEEEIIRTPGSGQLRHRQVSASPVRDRRGDVIGSVSVVRDITDRKRAEAQVIRGHKTFSELVERAPFGIYIVDSQFRIAQMNEGSQNGAFRNVRPVIGRDFAEAMHILWPEEVAAGIIAEFRHTLETGEPYHSPRFFSPRQDVQAVEGYECELHRMTLPDGKYGVVCYYFDSTDLRQAEEALREAKEQLEARVRERTAELTQAFDALRQSEQEFRSLAEAVPQIVWATRADGWSIYVNRQWTDYTGMTMEASLGHGWNTPLHPEDKQRVWDAWQHATRYHEPYSLECRLRRADGEYRWWLIRGSPMLGEHGEVLKWFGTCTDIEDLKNAEAALKEANDRLEQRVAQRTAALRESERLYRAIGESIDYGIWVCDPQGRNTYASESFLKLVGLTQEQCSDMGWGDVLHPDDVEATIEAWKQCVREGGPWYREHRFRGADGQWHPVLACGVAVRDERGELTAWAGINLDISRLKKTEKELRQAIEDLQRSNQDLQEFAYVASHDLQEPLRMVSGFMDLLQTSYGPHLDAKAREYIGYAVEGGIRMRQLVEDLLAYSRVAAKGQALQPTEAEQALTAAAENLGGAVQEAGASVTHDPLPTVKGDPVQLAQLFQNLIGNALKFRSPERPCRVHVSAAARDGQWLFSVRDNGIGIAAESVDRLFKIFERLHTRQQYPGTGIGLAICKKIVERHGGRIWVESTPGAGSTFHFTLPDN